MTLSGKQRLRAHLVQPPDHRWQNRGSKQGHGQGYQDSKKNKKVVKKASMFHIHMLHLIYVLFWLNLQVYFIVHKKLLNNSTLIQCTFTKMTYIFHSHRIKSYITTESCFSSQNASDLSWKIGQDYRLKPQQRKHNSERGLPNNH